MPRLTRKNQNVPDKLKPYANLGLDFATTTGKESLATCPFCSSEGKFSVTNETGQYRCFVCATGSENGGGNILTFIRSLYRLAQECTTDRQLKVLQSHRGLLCTDSLWEFGVVVNPVNGVYLIPGYDTNRNLKQLYRYNLKSHKPKPFATSTLSQQLFGIPAYNPECEVIYLCEGPWDAISLHEVIVDCGEQATTSVLSVPGVNTFNPLWCDIFEGREVNILFDNDYPKNNKQTGKKITPASFTGLKRTVGVLQSSKHKPSNINYLYWGEEGYDIDSEDGCDVRDILSQKEMGKRIDGYNWIYHRLVEVPESWLEFAAVKDSVTPEPCSSYEELRSYWEKAMSWTSGLNAGLVVMLSSIVSTNLVGDQLWVKIIGPASSGKSTLCEAVSVAKNHVLAKSTLRGFHSGFDMGDGNDTSLINACRNKTLVLKDGDTLLQSPNLSQILSEARDVYDTSSRTSYRNKASRDYEGVRFTFILCGTSSLRKIDSSELGERFLDCVIMHSIDDDLEDDILMRVAKEQARIMHLESGQSVSSNYPEFLLKAMQKTGGYVEYLRSNATKLMSQVSSRLDRDSLLACARLGKFVSYMRARPSNTQEEQEEREFGARLTKQLTRLMACITLVMCKRNPDEEVLNLVRKVAFDTARGKTLEIVQLLSDRGGMQLRAISLSVSSTTKDTQRLLLFMCAIGILKKFKSTKPGTTNSILYGLTDNIKRLYNKVLEFNKEN